MDTKHLLAVTEAAAYLSVTKQTVYQLTKHGLGTRVGNMWVFTRAELDNWRDHAPANGGRSAKRSDRDTAVRQRNTGGAEQPVVVSQRRTNQPRLPTTVNIDGALHWAGNASTTLCGKHWSPAQMVQPSAHVCGRCHAEAGTRKL